MTAIAMLALVAVTTLTGLSRAEDPTRRQEAPYEPDIYPSPLWLAMQVIPSPAVGLDDDGARFGLSWQITPVAYSWAIHRDLSPWRALVVEPHARQGGSIELFISPQVYFGERVTPTLRPGVRAYFPVLSRGEYLSLSLGSAYQRIDGEDGVAIEGGAYILFGILGLQLSRVVTEDAPLSTMASIRLRYF